MPDAMTSFLTGGKYINGDFTTFRYNFSLKPKVFL
jgi:hypothetical protein